MPLISQFYCILIYIYMELGGHHNSPQIHAKYGEFEVLITIDGKIINGNMPKKQMRLIEAMNYTIIVNQFKEFVYNDKKIIKISKRI